MIDVAFSLQDKLFQIAKVNNLKVDTLPTEGGGGLPLGNGSWSGCVGVLNRKEADVCTTGVDINIERKTVVDFTVPTDNTAPTIIAPSKNCLPKKFTM